MLTLTPADVLPQDMCGGPAAGEGWLDPGSLHRAVLSGLQPDTEYFYTYGSEVRICQQTEVSLASCAPMDVTGHWYVPCTRSWTPCDGPQPHHVPCASVMFAQEHGWSDEASFVTPPAVGPHSSVSMLAIADMGQAEVSR